ncbi:MAG TPA: NUDIX domain-containing protein [Candidatus Paceibacterota bacterium]|jgi:ADP-ribose pyrophosphatase YjhB (NUDIX family)|nr:NUDIX domain-containing protein [Candidatus Paceibacterota bacterium]
MELQVGVKIILQNTEGKFLLLQRNLEKYPEIKKNDSLDIVGGRIKIGTPLLENLKREVFEETKLNLTEEPKLTAAQDILRPDKHVVRLTYLGQINGEPVLDEDHSSYMWLSAEEIKNKDGLDQYFKEVFKKLNF